MSGDLEWRLKQMQDDMNIMWSRLTDLEAARDEKDEPYDVKDYIRATKPDAGEPTHKYFEACLQENAKLIEENKVLQYQYEAMKNETARCKEQIEKQRNFAECQGSTIQSSYEQRDELLKENKELKGLLTAQANNFRSLLNQRDELLIENKKLKEDLTKKYEGEKAAAIKLEESSTYWQQKYNKQLQETDFLNKRLDFFEKLAHDLEMEKNDAKWYKEHAVNACIDIVEQIKNDPLTVGGGRRWMVAICEDIQKAIKYEFGVK